MAHQSVIVYDVADFSNHTVRKMVVSTTAVTTLAGTPAQQGGTDGTGSAARFTSPQGVAADGAGNLYIADNGNSTIRKVAVATGAMTTVAGMAGAAGGTDGPGAAVRFNRPIDMAADGSGNLYATDSLNSTIRKSPSPTRP